MQKKTTWIILAVIVVVLVFGGYLIFHKSPKKTNISLSSTSSQTVAVNNSVLVTKINSTVGSYLTDPSDNTLYTDGSGATGVTNCPSSCLSAWPAYIDKGSTTDFPINVNVIKRSDNGEMQYTYKGQPLYYFSSDSKGEINGNNVAGFVVAKP